VSSVKYLTDSSPGPRRRSMPDEQVRSRTIHTSVRLVPWPARSPRASSSAVFAGALAVAFALLTPGAASADSISVNSSATNVSGSEWEYTYTLSGSLSAGDLLAIYFPRGNQRQYFEYHDERLRVHAFRPRARHGAPGRRRI
jgi:hypothetical protein